MCSESSVVVGCHQDCVKEWKPAVTHIYNSDLIAKIAQRWQAVVRICPAGTVTRLLMPHRLAASTAGPDLEPVCIV